MAERLRDRVAIVTGGGWNIGRGIARRFAAEGARVAVASRNVARLEETVARIRADGGEAVAIPADVTDYTAVEALVRTAAEQLGEIDIMASVAGGGSTDEAADEVSPETWDRILRTNLTSAFYCARAVLPSMRARDRGEILHVSGGGGFFAVTGVNSLAYACAKAAVCRLTDQLTAELLDTGIRVHCIDPGMVPDEQRLAAIEAEERRTATRLPGAEHRRRPEDAAELAAWLVSDESRPLRGRLVSVYDAWWRDPSGVAEVEGSVAACRLRRAEPQ